MKALLASGPSPNKVTERSKTRSRNTHLSPDCLVAKLAVALFAEFEESVRGTQRVAPARDIVGVLPAVIGTCLGRKCDDKSKRVGKGDLHVVSLLVHLKRAVNTLWGYSVED
jgi:hypothetical protein